MLKGKNIFITGGAGFIASYLVERLAGHNRIVIYDNFLRDSIHFTKYPDDRRVKIIRGDVLDTNLLKKSVKDCSVFIHCAAIAGIYSAVKKTSHTIHVNILGTSNLLEAIKGFQVDRFIDFSTSEVYGPFIYKDTEKDLTTQGPVYENRWAYSVSKLASEHLTYSYYQEYKIPVVIVRPFNVYGPRQTGEGAIQRMVIQTLTNKPITLYGDGTQIRAWCYVEDFVDGIIACLKKKEAVGQIFNLGNPQGTTTNLKLAEMIKRLTGSDSPILFKPHPGPEVEVRVPSISHAQNLLGFEPKITLEEGILKTIHWYRQHKELKVE